MKIVADIYKAVKAAKVILKNQKGSIPESKIEYLKDIIKAFLNKDEITDEDIQNSM